MCSLYNFYSFLNKTTFIIVVVLFNFFFLLFSPTVIY